MRVGRAAIDEQAMRLLEQHNPDVEFDWARLLRDVPQDQGARRERDRDPRDRERRDRREGRDHRANQRPRPLDTTAAAVPPLSPPVNDIATDIAEERAEAHADLVLEKAERSRDVEADEVTAESLAVTHGEPLAADHAEYVEYAEASGTLPAHEDCPAAARLGADGVTRLRARYVQLQARIAEKGLEDEARTELNARVERLNPDAWRTPDEVAAALEQYEAGFESLRAEVGRSPRHKL